MDRGNTVNVGVIAAAVGVPVVSIVAIIFTVVLISMCVRYNYKKQTDDEGNRISYCCYVLPATLTLCTVSFFIGLLCTIPDHRGALLQPQRTFSTRKSTSTVEDNLQLYQLPDGRFKQCTVKSNCQLKKFLKEEGLNFWRGCAYYEYHHDLEPNIFKDKQLLFMKVSYSITITVHVALSRSVEQVP